MEATLEALQAVVAWLEAHDRLAQWAAALGTLLAVVVSLYLARREGRTRIRVRADAGIGKGPDGVPLERQLFVNVTNHGLRPITVEWIGFQAWPWRRRSSIVAVGPPRSDRLPFRLEHGEEKSLRLPLDEWVKMTAKADQLTWWRVLRLRVHVHTTLGHIERRFVGNRLRRELFSYLARKAYERR